MHCSSLVNSCDIIGVAVSAALQWATGHLIVEHRYSDMLSLLAVMGCVGGLSTTSFFAIELYAPQWDAGYGCLERVKSKRMQAGRLAGASREQDAADDAKEQGGDAGGANGAERSTRT